MTPFVAPTPTPSLAVVSAREECQKVIAAASRTFAGKKLKGLDKCANGILECIQTIVDNRKRSSCIATAAARCTREIDRFSIEGGKLHSAVVAKCGALPLVAHDLTDESGLGYGAIAAACGSNLETPEEVAECVVQRQSCEIDHLFDEQEPRASELMEFAQVPPDRRAVMACLPSHGGKGEGVGFETTAGRAIARCEAAIKRAAARLVRTELGAFGKCVVRVFACEQTKRGNDMCRAKADAACARGFATIKAQRMNLGPSVDKKCGNALIDYDILRQPNAAYLDALAGECERFGVSDVADLERYKLCLLRQHQCRVEALLRFEAPRSEALIESLDLAPPFQFPSDFCPTPAPTP